MDLGKVNIKTMKTWIIALAGLIGALGVILGGYKTMKGYSYKLFYQEMVKQDARIVAEQVYNEKKASRRRR